MDQYDYLSINGQGDNGTVVVVWNYGTYGTMGRMIMGQGDYHWDNGTMDSTPLSCGVAPHYAPRTTHLASSRSFRIRLYSGLPELLFFSFDMGL
jgi:hypothetical protein